MFQIGTKFSTVYILFFHFFSVTRIMFDYIKLKKEPKLKYTEKKRTKIALFDQLDWVYIWWNVHGDAFLFKNKNVQRETN